MAIKQWIDENFDMILAGELPFDFGNYTAQEVADEYFGKELAEMGAPPDVINEVENLPPELFPKHEAPQSFAERTKEVFGEVYDTLKSFAKSFVNTLGSLFGG